MRSLGMFKKTEPQQELFKVDVGLPEALQKRLKGSWASVFQKEILPILMSLEGPFAILYGETGRPNYSVGRMLGLCLLQEFNNFSDQAALDAFGFDVRWQYALDVTPEKAYLSRRSVVEFRRRLVEHDPEMRLMRKVFEKISKTAIKKFELSTSEQRLDSTHIVSNICTRGRLDLFRKTITLFLKSLNEKDFGKVPPKIRKWHHENENSSGWFGMEPSAHKGKMAELACFLYRLIAVFERDLDVRRTEEFQLIARLFEENCDVKITTKKGPGGNRNSRKKPRKKSVKVTVKKRTQGTALQSPYDPDASHGLKGSGYSTHVAETCNNKGKPEIITDYEVHGAARSDVAKAPDVLDRLEASGMMPDTIYTDAGYPSPPSTLRIQASGVELFAPVHRSRIKEAVMSRADFTFDNSGLVLKCPAGNEPIDHRERISQNNVDSVLHAIFDGNRCRDCNMLEQCPVRAPNHRARGCKPRDTVGNFRLEIPPTLMLRDEMFAKQQTDEWKQRYRIRSGVEATMSELKRCHGLGKLRVRRLPRVQFAVACKVTACNIRRWVVAFVGNPELFRRILIRTVQILEAKSNSTRMTHFA